MLVASGRARFHEVSRDFGLAVDGDGFAARQGLQVDAYAPACEGELDALVHDAILIHAGADPGFAQQIDRALFEHAGPDTPQNVLGRLPFEDDVVDSGLRQQLAQQQAGRACADDGDLGFHCVPPSFSPPRANAMDTRFRFLMPELFNTADLAGREESALNLHFWKVLNQSGAGWGE
jgi:hypothetical protein